MHEESRLIMSIWENLDNFISKADKPTAAKAIVRAFIEMGYEPQTLFDLEGEDEHLDAALTEALEEEGGQEDDPDYL